MTRIGLGTLAALVACLALSAGALAWWSTGGGGAGGGPADAAAAKVSITAGSASPTLLPNGAPSGDVSATITNPNSYAVHLPQLALDGATGSGGFSGNASGCALSFATQTNGGAGWDVPASGSLDVILTSALTMGTAAADTCQGLTFTVYLVAS
jgi:hypothetical protein